MKRILVILLIAFAAFSCGKALDNSMFVPGPGDEGQSGSAPDKEIVPDVIEEGQIKVMSFNVRTSTGDVNHATHNWTVRSEAARQLLLKENPTVFGVQEARKDQVTFLENALPEYGSYGVGRDDGVSGGEHMTIFYKKDVVEMGKHGTFWLSETPDVPGSKGWDAAYIRTATWAEFTVVGSGKKFFFVNTHIDNSGALAKTESLKLIVDKINTFNPEALPAVITADFNAASTHSMFEVLEENKYKNARTESPVTDALNTYNAWGGSGSVIDHIYLKGFEALRYKTVIDSYGGVRYVSDHYPIYTLLKFKN